MPFRPKMPFSARNSFSVKYGYLSQKCQWIRIDLITSILVRMAFKSEMTFWPEMTFLPELAFQPEMLFFPERLFLSEMSFWQKLLFSRKCFLAKNNFVKFEVAFWSEMSFWLEMSFCQIWLKRLTSQSIERFGSPLMAESFQACYFLYFFIVCFVSKYF